MIEALNLTKRYNQVVAVNDLSLTVKEGELFGFLGPNGAGKTTTIKIMSGLIRPTSGKVRIRGIDIAEKPEEAKKVIGYIPDRPFIYDKLTGREYLRFVCGLYGLNGNEVKGKGEELLEMFELADWGSELVEAYSHGMKQRLVLAATLLHNPEVLIVDEPMVGLDPKGARLIKDIFRSHCSRGGCVFMSTHTLEVAEQLCDTIAIIQAGKIIAEGTMEDLRAKAGASGRKLEEIFLKLTGGSGGGEGFEQCP